MTAEGRRREETVKDAGEMGLEGDSTQGHTFILRMRRSIIERTVTVLDKA